MALTTQDPQLQLVGGQLGSQARLQAGTDYIYSRPDNINVLTIALFHGPRPSALEIETGVYMFENSTPQYNMIGIWQFGKEDFVQLAAESAFMHDPAQPQNVVQNGQAMPHDESDMIATDQLDYFHAVFRRNTLKNIWSADNRNSQISAEGRALGNGYAPTWGLVALHQPSPDWDNVFRNNGNASHSIRRSTGETQQVNARGARWPYIHYITVGDWQDDPTANLTLYRGAEADRTSQPHQISPQRLRMRFNPMVPVNLGA